MHGHNAKLVREKQEFIALMIGEIKLKSDGHIAIRFFSSALPRCQQSQALQIMKNRIDRNRL